MKVSYKVLFAAILATAGTPAIAADAAVTGLATTNYVKGAIESLDSSVATANGAVDTITETNGKITATHKLLKNADIATDAAIATSKISGLDTALNGKQLKTNIVNPNSEGKFATGEETSTDKYPSMKAAAQIAASAAADAVLSVNSTLDSLDYTNPDGNGMIRTISQTDGQISATRDLVAEADLDTTLKTKINNKANSTDVYSKAVIGDGYTTTATVKAAIADAKKAGEDANEAAVHKTGNETIAGTKTFSTQPVSTTTTTYADAANNALVTKGQVASAISGIATTASTAVQSASGSNGVSATKSGTTITVSGINATTTAKGVVQLTDTYTNTDSTKAVTGKAVASAIGNIAATSLQGACADGDTNCALVNLGGTKQWLPIINSYE